MIVSVHYRSENNNRISVYNYKRTRLTPKMTTANIIVTCYVNEEALNDLNTFLCVRTHQFRSSSLLIRE